MAEVSFAYVPAEGFTAFGVELRAGEWAEVNASKYVGADGRVSKAMCAAPATAVMKLQMEGAIRVVAEALKSSGSAKACDDEWDVMEKRLGVMISAAMVSKDPAKRAAAERLHKILLLGDGAAQTKLKYHQEVDFGRKQIELSSGGQCAADVTLLGLSEVLHDVGSATEALADAIGHGTTGDSPSRRKTIALQQCRNAFAVAIEQLDWIIEHGADKERANALRKPLVELAARYPKKSARNNIDPVRAPVVTQ